MGEEIRRYGRYSGDSTAMTPNRDLFCRKKQSAILRITGKSTSKSAK